MIIIIAAKKVKKLIMGQTGQITQSQISQKIISFLKIIY